MFASRRLLCAFLALSGVNAVADPSSYVVVVA